MKRNLDECNSMKSVIGAVSLLALSLPFCADESQADSGTPAEQYTALLKEYRPVSGGMRKATTDL
jgi:hypothetical protein